MNKSQATNILPFLLCMFSYMVSYTQSEIVWSKNIGGSHIDKIVDIVQHSNNSCIVLGNFSSTNSNFGSSQGSSDIFLLEIDENGNEGESSTLGTISKDLGSAILKNQDNFTVTSLEYSSAESLNRIIYNTFDSNLNLQSSEIKSDFDNVQLSYSFQTEDKSIVSLGARKFKNDSDLNPSFGGHDAFLYHSNSANNSWDKSIGGRSFDVATSAIDLHDGSIIAVGYTFSKNGFDRSSFGKKDAWAAKVDKEGSILWTKRFGSQGYESFASVCKTFSGDVIIVGEKGFEISDDPVNKGVYQSDVWVLSLTDEGEQVWEKNYGGSEDEKAVKILPDGNGDYLIVANTYSNDGIISQHRGRQDGWVISINSSGNLIWQKTYGGEGKDELKNALIDDLGSIWLVGNSDSKTGDVNQPKGNKDGWVLKLAGTAPSFFANLGPDMTICKGEQIELVVQTPNCDCSYQWSDGSSNPSLIINPQSNNNYSVTITNETGQSAFDDINVNVNNSPLVNILIANPSCNNFNDGSINLEILEGEEPFNYMWNNESLSPQQMNLPAGFYELTMTDNIGCSSIQSVTLTSPAELNSILNVISPTCGEEGNGSAEVIVTGGTAPYSYRWSNGGNESSIFDLEGGLYTLTITDNNQCELIEEVEISTPGNIQVQEQIYAEACSEEASGVIELVISGGQEPYEIIWSTGESDSSIENLGTGEYIVTITDNNGCQSINNYSIISGEALQIDFLLTQPTCFDSEDGSIEIISNEETTLGYVWENEESNAYRDNLISGSYSVTISNEFNCEEILTFELFNPVQLEINSDLKNESCFDESDGRISLSISGGTGEKEIAWSNGLSDAEISDLKAGIYDVVITDENGCSLEQSFEIFNPDQLLVQGEIDQNICSPENDAMINLVVEGNQGDIEVSWSNGTNALIQNELSPGIYMVTVTDENACEESAEFEIFPFTAIEYESEINEITCNGKNDGNIEVFLVAGTEPISYLWSDGSNSNKIEMLEEGIHYLTLTDANDCREIVEFEILQPTQISVDIEVGHVLCYAESNGTLELTIAGGLPPYELNISTQDGELINNNTVAENEAVLLDELLPGIYNIQIQDSNLCEYIGQREVLEGELVDVNFDIQDISCPGLNDGSIEILPGVKGLDYTYSWSNGEIGALIENLQGGAFIVTIADENGCEFLYQIFISGPEPFEMIAASEDEKCEGEENGEIAISFSGGTAPYDYDWSNGADSSHVFQLTPGEYELLILDANDCAFDTTFIIEPALEIDVQIQTNEPDPIESNGSITLEIMGGEEPYLVEWSNGSIGASLENLPEGNYQYTITDGFECTKSGEIILESTGPLSNVKSLDISLNLYPNPASEFVIVEFKNEVKHSFFQLINQLGQTYDVEIIGNDHNSVILDTSYLESGIYFVKMPGEQVSWAKICIQKTE